MATSATPILDKRAQSEGFKKHFGNRVEVFNGTAKCVKRVNKKTGKISTRSCVTKDKLTKNKRGELVLASRSKQGKKNFSNLIKAGFTTKKGEFGVFKNGVNITAKKMSKKASKKASKKVSKKTAKPFFGW